MICFWPAKWECVLVLGTYTLLVPLALGKKYNKIAHDQVCVEPFVRGMITGEFRAAIVKWRELANSGKSMNAIAKITNSQRPTAE
jgi:hypothetical protein